MKVSELRDMTSDALQKELSDSFREQFNLRIQKQTQQLVKPHLLAVVRKRIARIQTVMRQKQGGAQ